LNIEQAREQIKRLEDYIDMVENYQPATFEQVAIKRYVIIESVNKVAAELNEEGYRMGNRKLVGKDITNIIHEKPKDDMHQTAQKMFKANRKRASKNW
jgi:hypothetical protein